MTIRLPRKIAAVRIIGGPGTADQAVARAVSEADVQARAGAMVDAKIRQLASAIQAVEAAAAQIEAERQQVMKQAEAEMVDLAVNIARKVLMQEIQAGRYEIDPIVKEALGSVQQRQGIVVHLNPADLARCETARQAGDAADAVQFVADESIPPAQCLVETTQGPVESTLEGHLEQVADALKEL